MTPAQLVIAEGIEQQAQSNYDEAIHHATKAIWRAQPEDNKLTEIIRRKRLEIQRSPFQEYIPLTYPKVRKRRQSAFTKRLGKWPG